MGDLKDISELTKEVRQFVYDLFGPAAKEAGEIFGDHLKYIRLKNALRILEKARKLLHDKNIRPKAVTLKILVPLLEGASLEDEEDLASKWVGLLASAASSPPVHPSFPKILSDLSPTEARMLDRIYDRGAEKFLLEEFTNFEGLSDDESFVALNNLFRLQLCEPKFLTSQPKYDQFSLDVDIGGFDLTSFGKSFVKACRGP